MGILERRRAKALVRDLYRAVLGREPDPDGASTYESLILDIGADRAVPKILRAFRRSAEFQKRADALAISYISNSLTSQGDRVINGRPVEHLVSLGSFCLPALLFRDNGLRRYSSPFDWIFSTPQMLRDCLADDFALFLNRGYYRSLSEERHEPGAEHELFRERYGIPGLFAHRDPTREADYQYFVRCVTRLRQLLQSEDAKLFMLIGRANHDLTNEFPRVIEALDHATKNFVLLALDLVDPIERGLTSLVHLSRIGEHTLHRFVPSSYSAVGAFLPERLDQWTVLRLLSRYRLELKDSPGIESDAVEGVDGDPLAPSEPQKTEHALT